MIHTKKRRVQRKPSQLDHLAAEVATLRRDVNLIAMQGKIDELQTRVARLEADLLDK